MPEQRCETCRFYQDGVCEYPFPALEDLETAYYALLPASMHLMRLDMAPEHGAECRCWEVAE